MITAIVLATTLTSLAAQTSPPLKARVHVDAGYGHDKELNAVFAEASAILEKSLGTGVAIAEQKPWKPSRAASVNVRAGLAELEREDDGKGVDLVVAFITKPPKPTTDYHQLGNSKPLAKQMIIRAADDVHEEALILVHHIAHALAGVHAGDTSTVLSQTYAPAQKDKPFNDDQLALLKPGLQHIVGKTEKDRGSAVAQVTRELSARKGKLDAAGAEELKSAIDELAGNASEELVLPPEQARVVNDAVARMNKGDAAGAFATIKPLADKPNAPPQVQSIACRLAADEKVKDADAGRCDRALKATHDVDTANAAIRYALKIKSDPAVKRAFAEAKARLEKARAGGAEIDELAGLAQGTGRLTLAEDALAKSAAPNAAALKQKIDLDRKRQGIPRGLLTSDNEAELIDRLQIIARDDDAHKGDDIESALHKFGEVPALYIEKCDWQIQKGTLRDAEQTCEKVLKMYPESSMGFLVAGIAYAQDELPSKAIPLLEKALKMDPELPNIYEALAPLYHQTGKRDLEKQLAATYESKFKKPMPKPNRGD